MTVCQVREYSIKHPKPIHVTINIWKKRTLIEVIQWNNKLYLQTNKVLLCITECRKLSSRSNHNT